MDLSQFSDLHVSEDYNVTDSHSCDRFSELPNSLILETLSLVPMGDVVRTTLLSKRWKDLWTTVPCLDFDFYEHDRNFVRGALAQWKGAKILKFSLGFYENNDASTSDIDSYLLFAFEKQVEDLFIDLGPWFSKNNDSNIEYCPPQPLFTCSSITKLMLRCCKLKIGEIVQWNLLKSLEIQAVKSLSEDALSQILCGAPRLEELILYFDEIRENSTIRSTSLKVLKFQKHYDYVRRKGTVRKGTVLRLWAPNLTTIKLSGICIDTSWLLNVPSLTDATLHFESYGNGIHSRMLDQVFRSICHVKNVTLSRWCIKFLVDMKGKAMVVHFSNAKYLKLDGCKAEEMLDILEMCPQLMILIVEPDKVRYRIPSKTNLASPSLLQLKTVKISLDVNDPSLILAIEIMLQNAHLLDKMEFGPRSLRVTEQELRLMAEKKVLSMPRSSPTAEVIIIKGCFY